MKHVIMDSRDVNGDGVNVFIKDDKLCVEITDDAGMSGGAWFMEVNGLIDEIQRYRGKQYRSKVHEIFKEDKDYENV